jgi:hypothetical protein
LVPNRVAGPILLSPVAWAGSLNFDFGQVDLTRTDTPAAAFGFFKLAGCFKLRRMGAE